MVKIHFDVQASVVLNVEETLIIDSAVNKNDLLAKYPRNKVISGSDANRLLGVDNNGDQLKSKIDTDKENYRYYTKKLHRICCTVCRQCYYGPSTSLKCHLKHSIYPKECADYNLNDCQRRVNRS